MAKGICLALGLNVVNTGSPAYQGASVPTLQGCVNDAVAVADALRRLPGFDPPTVLTNDQATHDALLARIDAAAKVVAPGDLFVLHYSGHGMKGGYGPTGQPDPDANATSWILYDRPLSHAELYARWGSFARGVRILVLSDSCHSGAAIRSLGVGGGYAERGLDRFARLQVLRNLRGVEAPRVNASTPSAALLLISGCQVEETSLDTTDSRGKPHGLFSSTLLDVWNNGGFTGDYVTFHHQVAQQTNARSRQLDRSHPQNPNFFPLGDPVDTAIFSLSSPPFRV
jgi:hypothetical protein